MNWWRLRRTVHSSWLIAVASVGVASGIIAVQYVPQGWFSSSIWLTVAVGLMVIGLWSRWLVMVVAVLLAGVLLGLWRGAATLQSLAPYERLIGTQVELRGLVKEDVERDAHGALVVRLGEIRVAQHPLPGAVRVSLNAQADIKRGDRIAVKGKLADGFAWTREAIDVRNRAMLDNLEWVLGRLAPRANATRKPA